MQKTEAIRLLGGTPGSAAKLMGISRQAVGKWPDPLPQRIADRVLGVISRLPRASPGRRAADRFIDTKGA